MLLTIGIGIALPAASASAALTWSGAMPLGAPPNDLQSVACESSTLCVTVNFSGDVFTFNPETGSVLNGPISVLGGQSGFSVACAPAGDCTAVGTNGYEGTFNPNTGGSVTTARIDSAVSTDFTGVACPATTECVGVTDTGYAVEFNPIAGTVGYDHGIDSGYQFHAVTCWATYQCTATDNFLSEVTFNPLQFIYTAPTVYFVDSVNDNVESVACFSSTECVGVDGAGDATTFNSSNGSVVVGATGIDQGEGPLYGVSCASSTQCTAVGYNDLEVTFNPQNEGVLSGPTLLGGASHRMSGVACPVSEQCVMVDEGGNYFTTTNPLAVSFAGSGAGTVTGGDADCTGACTVNENWGASVTLTATPAAGSAFTGWSGAGCSGTGTCTVSMATSQSVTATFGPAPVAAGSTTNSGSNGSTTTTAPTGAATNPVSPAGTVSISATLTSISSKRSTVKETLSCASSSPSSCALTVTLSVVKTLRGHKRVNVAPAAKSTTTTRTVVIGMATQTISAGQVATIAVTLNGAGRSLLATLHKLHLTAVTKLANGTLVANRTVTVTKPTAHHRK